MEATYMMADLFLAAQTAQVESSVNVMEVSVVVITLALILALFFYIRLIHKNSDSDFMNIKKDIDENKKQLLNIEKKIDELHNKFDSMNRSEKASSGSTTEKITIPNKVVNKNVSTQVVTIVKYGDFYMEDNVPVVENRDLSDDNQAGCFMITMHENASTATYTLNKEKINSIMQDVAVIANYVDNLQGSYDAKSIKAIDNGTLVRNGNKWVINKKMKVKLIKK